jgi:hypothetical protein
MPVALGISSLTGLQKSMINGLAKEHATEMFFFIYCYSKREIYIYTFLLTAVGLSPGGSTHLHTNTQYLYFSAAV